MRPNSLKLNSPSFNSHNPPLPRSLSLPLFLPLFSISLSLDSLEEKSVGFSDSSATADWKFVLRRTSRRQPLLLSEIPRCCAVVTTVRFPQAPSQTVVASLLSHRRKVSSAVVLGPPSAAAAATGKGSRCCHAVGEAHVVAATAGQHGCYPRYPNHYEQPRTPSEQPRFHPAR